MPYDFVADSFRQINFVADFLQASAILEENRPFCVFEPPLGAYGQRKMIILGSLESAW